MKEFFLRINGYLAIDKAISYGVLTRIWGLLSGLVSMFVISRSFGLEQQGYFFTFANLLALQIFFELGLTYVIAQFASHEFAYLSWGENGDIDGDEVHLRRLQDLLFKSIKWFGLASILISVILIPVGIIFFGHAQKADPTFSWRLPWILSVIGTSLNLFIVPFFAVIMGSGDVAAVNYREMLGNVFGFCFAWAIMLMHGGLFAFCALTWCTAIISWIYLMKNKPELLRLSIKNVVTKLSPTNSHSISWQHEIWPMQWKIAVSWIFGYFINNLFNPVLFHYHGAVVAGQMGLTLTATNGLFALSMTWIIAKSPELGKLIAKSDWQKLDNLFYKILFPSVVTVSLSSLLGWSMLRYLQQHYTALGDRFIPANQAALLLGSAILQVVVNGFAIYLRAHKQEPFLINTIIGSFLISCSTLYLGREYSSLGIVAGYFAIQILFGLPFSYLIWKRCRREWHQGIHDQVKVAP